ncbi:Ubiquitin fusion degradation protein 4, partial [Linderina pennispora]
MPDSIEELVACLESPDSVTCYELMQSGIIDSLLGIISRKEASHDETSQLIACLLRAKDDAVSAFVILLSRLHEALNLTEDIRIQEAYQTPSDETRSAAHMLTKQLRFKVVPADEQSVASMTAGFNDEPLAREITATMSRIRQSFQNITVSVHAIATFSVLEAYLRPRIALSIGQNRRRRRRHRHSQQPNPDQDHSTSAASKKEEGSDSSQRPQQAQLERQPHGSEQGPSSRRRSGKSRSEGLNRDHVRMLQMIAQSSGIDLRASDLFDRLGADMSGDDEDLTSDSESDGDDEKDQDMSDGRDGGDKEMAEDTSDGGKKAQDWHIVIKLKCEDEERVVSSSENIFRVVSEMCQHSESLKTANPWVQVFTLQFHIEFGQSKPDDAAGIAEQRVQLASPDREQLDEMLGKQSAAIIELIKQLHEHLPQAVRILHQKRLITEDSELFINRKIAAKVTRQLDDPLYVVCGAIPRWCHQLVHYIPFLVPFETRLAYLQATSFGYSRNISRWQTLAQREARNGSSRASDIQIPLGRIQRQKVRISRHRMLESALKVMELYGTAKTILEVEYFDEVGTGLGPTLEFYATVSRTLRDKSLELWRDPTGSASTARPADKAAKPDYIDSQLGLFPRAINPTVPTTSLAAGKTDESGK